MLKPSRMTFSRRGWEWEGIPPLKKLALDRIRLGANGTE